MGSYDKACNDVNAVRFVQQHLKECELIAKQLNVPVENILGLAAAEAVLPGNITTISPCMPLHHFSQAKSVRTVTRKPGWLLFRLFQSVHDLLQ